METSSVAGAAAPGVGPAGVGPAGVGPAGVGEMARLDAALAARPVREAVGLTIREGHRPAAEAIAWRHRYDLRAVELRAADVGEDGLLWIELRPR